MQTHSITHEIHSIRTDLLRTEYAFLLLQQAMLLKRRHHHKADDDPDGDWDDDWASDDIAKFRRHFDDHGKGVGAKNWNDYAKKSQEFYQRFQQEKLPAVESKDGWIKVYDPKTNTFGSYNPSGKAETFYSAKPQYYNNVVNTELGNGGRIINPLEGGGEGVGGGNIFINPLHPHQNPFDFEE